MSEVSIVRAGGEMVRRESPSVLRQPVHDFSEMIQICEQLAKSGYFKDAREVSQAMVKVMLGQELGLSPVTAMMSIFIVEGKPSLSAQLMLALVKASGKYDYRVLDSTDKRAEIEWYQLQGHEMESLGRSAFTIQEASAAGLAGRNVWKAYPTDMLMWRAAARGFRRFTPDLAGGAPLYAKEEMDDMQALGSGEEIDLTTRQATARPRMSRRSRMTVDAPTSTIVEHEAEPRPVTPQAPPTPAEEKAWRREANSRLTDAYNRVVGLPTAGNNGEALRFTDYVKRTLSTDKQAKDFTTAEIDLAAASIESVPNLKEQVYLHSELTMYPDLCDFLAAKGLELSPTEALVTEPEWQTALVIVSQKPEVEAEAQGDLFGRGDDDGP